MAEPDKPVDLSAQRSDAAATPVNGEVRINNGVRSVFYDGYWIRHYEIPTDDVAARRDLIDQLTKRVFHHTEPGINTPGHKLADARSAYEDESDAIRKRVKAAMLAGALLNRGSDIFSVIFELRQRGIEITQENELLLECESCFIEALELGKQVLHYSGEEGLDELWGEPLKAFYMPVAEYYRSRYIKIALTMREIDEIATKVLAVFEGREGFEKLPELIGAYCRAAKADSETMKTDPAIFHVWPEFVASGDRLYSFEVGPDGDHWGPAIQEHAISLVREAKRLIQWVAMARVPMPKTTENFIARCDRMVETLTSADAA